MRKPNYRFERAERDRLKLAKKEEKAKRQHQERASDQKSDEAGQPASLGGERQRHHARLRHQRLCRWLKVGTPAGWPQRRDLRMVVRFAAPSGAPQHWR